MLAFPRPLPKRRQVKEMPHCRPAMGAIPWGIQTRQVLHYLSHPSTGQQSTGPRATAGAGAEAISACGERGEG